MELFKRIINWNLNISWWWYLIFALSGLLLGFLFRYNWINFFQAYWERRELMNFAQGVHMAAIQADIGQGKTLLMSILARSMSHGIKKVGFVSNIPDAQLLSYNDLNFQEKVPRKDTYRIPKYFFLDETNYYIDGVNVAANRLYHEGVSQLCQQARHQKIHLWISATRGNHVWVAVREMVNYHVKLGGLTHLFNLGSYQFFTLKINFYSQSWEHKRTFNILVSNLDFELYDSYWLKDTSYWRIQEGT